MSEESDAGTAYSPGTASPWSSTRFSSPSGTWNPPVTASDIARWAGHQVNTISMIADRMVRAGLLNRERDLPDRRQVRFTVTKKAEEILKQATPPVWTLAEDALSSLSPKQKATLADLLGKVRAGLLPHFTRLAKYAPPLHWIST
jgi:DNA-binding MarR family transcriptional regulator